MRNGKDPKEAIEIIKKYKDILKGKNKKIINIVCKEDPKNYMNHMTHPFSSVDTSIFFSRNQQILLY